jgi:hypothetical protein
MEPVQLVVRGRPVELAAGAGDVAVQRHSIEKITFRMRV